MGKPTDLNQEPSPIFSPVRTLTESMNTVAGATLKMTTDEVTENQSTESITSVKNWLTVMTVACSILKKRLETTVASHGKCNTFQVPVPEYPTCSSLEVKLTNNTNSQPLTKNKVAYFKMESKILSELVAANTHSDSHTTHCLEKEDAAMDQLMIPPFKNAARIMLPESPVR